MSRRLDLRRPRSSREDLVRFSCPHSSHIYMVHVCDSKRKRQRWAQITKSCILSHRSCRSLGPNLTNSTEHTSTFLSADHSSPSFFSLTVPWKRHMILHVTCRHVRQSPSPACTCAYRAAAAAWLRPTATSYCTVLQVAACEWWGADVF